MSQPPRQFGRSKGADSGDAGLRLVIVGAGPAAVAAVEALRSRDQRARLTVISAEPYLPYSPPAMAHHFLSNSATHLWRDEAWLEAMGVDYRCGTRVVRVVPGLNSLELSDGSELRYDRLLLAPGSRLHAPLDGVDLPGVDNFKSLSAAEALIGRVRRGEAKTAVVVGAGFIGLEIALLLRQLGLEVTLVEKQSQVMPTTLDGPTAMYVRDVLLRRGIDLRLGLMAAAFVEPPRAYGVMMIPHGVLRANVLIAATGVKPNTDFLFDAGLDQGWGLKVDSQLRTSVPNIWAAGDAVEAHNRLTGQPYVHANFVNAVAQGRVAGANMVGAGQRYEGAEWLNSLKHLDMPVVVQGSHDGDELLSWTEGQRRRAVYLDKNRIVGFQLLGDISAAGQLRALMLQRRDVSAIKHRLASPGLNPGDLVLPGLSGVVAGLPSLD